VFTPERSGEAVMLTDAQVWQVLQQVPDPEIPVISVVFNYTGMSPDETQDFLQDLTDRITQPQFCYAHEYKKGDLLIIDDRASMHKAGFDYDHNQHRRMYRMLVRGDRPY
jgi:alpha-ketoglutarate-dependent taurine dioxygenase